MSEQFIEEAQSNWPDADSIARRKRQKELSELQQQAIDANRQVVVIALDNERLAGELAAANARVAELERERDEAIRMLAEWCVMVQINGSGWDDWDEAYKDAAYRPCGIRELIDDAIDKEKARWKEEYGRE